MDDKNFALTRLYHPLGAQVSIPLDLNIQITPEQASNLLNGVETLINAGWLINVPGLEKGELMEEVISVSRREGNDKAAIIGFYVAHPKMVNKLLHVYLNTVDDIKAFEQASGLKLSAIPLYDGDQFLAKDSPKAQKYIIILPRPIKVVYEISDKWKRWEAEGKSGKEPQKNILLRYDGYNPVSSSAKADPATGEIIESDTAHGAVPQQYNKTDGKFVQMLVAKTGLKPTVIMPILAKVATQTISFESAIKLIETNTSKTE